MSVENPQNKDLIMSKRFAVIQDICGSVAFMLAIFQGITLIIPAQCFLVLTGVILVVEYASTHFESVFFDKGNHIRKIGLIDNSFNEKRIPNYNSELYYKNEVISIAEIKLLANVHESSLFTSHIAEKMSFPYYIFAAIAFLFFILNLFMSGMDDYTSLLLSFIVSNSFFDRAMKLKSLKKTSEEVYVKANEICNAYEKSPVKTNMIFPQIIEILLIYENAIFETKIILSKRIFNKFSTSLSKEWMNIRDNYSIYKNPKMMKA